MAREVRDGFTPRTLLRAEAIIGMVHGVRSLGSAALDMVYVATGAVDVFWEAGCWEWDIA